MFSTANKCVKNRDKCVEIVDNRANELEMQYFD